MIKINALLKRWELNEFDREALELEKERLYNALQTLYENGLIDRDKIEKESDKLATAYCRYRRKIKKLV